MAKSKIERKKPKLNPKQELFCQLYATEREFFGNGVQSYIEAYDVTVGHGESKSTYDTCRAVASEMLTNPNILARIDELLELGPLSTQSADKTLAFWMTQRAFPDASMSAVKEFNKLKGRIIEKSKVTYTQKLDIDDLRAIIGKLPPERQEYYYGVITELIAEADLRGSGTQGKSRNP
jgi:hypothetical protein